VPHKAAKPPAKKSTEKTPKKHRLKKAKAANAKKSAAAKKSVRQYHNQKSKKAGKRKKIPLSQSSSKPIAAIQDHRRFVVKIFPQRHKELQRIKLSDLCVLTGNLRTGFTIEAI
jgi:hypothetical protein